MQELFTRDLIKELGSDHSKLIPILNGIQHHFGYLAMEEIDLLSHELQLPKSKIWGVITFYSHYRLQAPPKFHVRVCEGTACHVKSSKMLKQTFKDHADDSMDHEIEAVACLGCCALAPVFEVNGEIRAAMTTKKVFELIDEMKEEDA